MPIELGDAVLLVDEESGDTFLVRVSERTRVMTGHGFIDAGEILRRNYGDIIHSSTRGNFLAIKPSVPDFVEKLRRGPQIITLKDMGSIAAYCGIGPGQKVIEGGGGSGAATVFLASLVGPEGKVHCYEIREDFLKLVEENVSRSGLSDRVDLKLADVYLGIAERDADAVLLDIPEPWRMLAHASDALRAGGYLACYVPTTDQMERLVCSDPEGPFKSFRCFAVIEMEYQVKANATRPKNMGLVHTGFICIARKL